MSTQHHSGEGDADFRACSDHYKSMTTKGQGNRTLTTEPEDEETPPRVRERNWKTALYSQVKANAPEAWPEVRW